MSTQELLKQIQKLSIEEQRQILEALTDNVADHGKTESGPTSEAEFEGRSMQKGVITEITPGTEEDDDSEPITVKDKPLSETIVE